MQIDVHFDVKNLEKILSNLKSTIVPAATARALNKTMQSAQSTAVKSIAANIGIKQQDVRRWLSIERANPHRLTATLSANNPRRLPIIKIDPRATQDDTGVTYRGQGGQSRPIPQAFIATMKSGHRGVFKRVGTSRLPILELQGPSVPRVFLNQAIQSAIKETIHARWPSNLEHEVSFELQRRGYTR